MPACYGYAAIVFCQMAAKINHIGSDAKGANMAIRERHRTGPPPGRAYRGSSLGIKAADILTVARQLQKGLPYQALVRFQKASQLSLDAIAKVLRLPRRTLARRKAQGKLSGPESERLYRLAVVFEKAVDLFEDVSAARAWLETPSKALAQQSPLAASEAELGAREVEDLIGRLEHGVFS
jgi:putative toxin-antitoxin system antitoxin component (TIGR02293 family)